MGPHTSLTPKIFKLNVHLRYMQVPLSTNFPIKTCLLQGVVTPIGAVVIAATGVKKFWPSFLFLDRLSLVCVLEGALVKKNDYQSKDKLYNARIQFKLLLKNVSNQQSIRWLIIPADDS